MKTEKTMVTIDTIPVMIALDTFVGIRDDFQSSIEIKSVGGLTGEEFLAFAELADRLIDTCHKGEIEVEFIG